MKPKFFTLFAALTLSAGALFASDTAVDGIYYDFDATNLTAAVTYRGSSASEYDEYTGDVVIPATVTYGGKTYSVTSIGDWAFSSGGGAYYGCSDLTSVTIPNSVTSIGKEAFYGCSDLTSVTIPNSVTSIGRSAFEGTAWLENQPDGVIYINQMLYTYKGEMPANTSIVVRDGTTQICGGAFDGCSGLTSVTIPNSVTSIGRYAFWYCSTLTSVTIGNSVTSIGESAFAYCSGLTSVTIPNSVTSIGKEAFEGTAWLANQPDGVIYINQRLYTYKGEMPANTSIVVRDGTTQICGGAFDGCSGLTSVTIPNSVTSIGGGAFASCSGLTKTNYTGDIAGWCDINFGGYSSNPTAYSHNLYINDVEVKDLVIPNSVTSIGDYAFEGCSGLTSVTIPNSVTSIGDYAFDGCSSLTKTNYTGDIAGWCGIHFGNYSANPTAYSHNLYINDVEVKDLVIPNSVTSIGDYAFDGCSSLTSVTIPNSVTSIGFGAFEDCSGLTSVTIPNSVTSIGEEAFYDCSGLTSVTIGNSVTSIGDYAFVDCSSLTSVTIPNSVTSIGDGAFSGCSGLTSVTIGNSVTSIGGWAFYGCSDLTSVTIGNSVTSIGEEAFSGCTKLINIVCYAAEPPSCDASVFANYNVFLKVPCNNLTAYQTHVYWGSFKYISCIGSEEVQVTEFSVTPSTNEAQFTWPAEPNAATYELVISKDGVVFCTLTFNASGQLMGIAFAPGANTAETTTTSGFQFTVTGLDEASHYTYTFDAKDAGGSVVKHYTGEFNTDGSVGLEQIELSGLYTQAGRIVCNGEFRIYDLLGRDVTRLNGSLSGVYVVKTENAAQKVIVK